MSNDETRNNLPIPTGDDGFNDNTGNDRLIQGTIIRCVDGHWSDRDGLAFPAETKMLALATGMALQKWKDQLPVDTIIKQPSVPLPDLDQLNAKIPQSEWEFGLDNRPRPPWVRQHIVYLLDPSDAALYTFINGTIGAQTAVERLKNKVVWMRQLRGANVVPLVKLDSKPMKTKFGPKKRPEFTILEWRQLGGGGPQDGSPTSIEHRTAAQQPHSHDCAGLQPVEPVSIEEELNDEIPDLG